MISLFVNNTDDTDFTQYLENSGIGYTCIGKSALSRSKEYGYIERYVQYNVDITVSDLTALKLKYDIKQSLFL